MLIQWFPGHMAKTKRLIIEHLKAVDVAAELLDARIPLSSANPMVEELLSGKPRIVILNKADLADPGMTKAWESYYKRKGVAAVSMSCGNGKDKKKFLRLIKEAAGPMLEKWKLRGLKTRSVRIMILGIPNVGKSTLINFISGTAAARTANTPGHTRGKQWVRLSQGLDLLDTPGVLWPKFEDQAVGQKLAISGSIKDDILNITELAMKLADYMSKNYPGTMASRYGIEESDDSVKVLADIAIAKCCLMKGGEPNIDKAASMLIDDFRSLRLGKVTLEQTPQSEEE